MEFRNSSDKEVVKIANVSKGEIIEFSGETKQINSVAYPVHTNFHNDFNYMFPKIFPIQENVFTTNLDANITISYSPIARVGVI